MKVFKIIFNLTVWLLWLFLLAVSLILLIITPVNPSWYVLLFCVVVTTISAIREK
jgi:hypothetical protein